MSRFLCKHSDRWSTAETAAVNLKLNSPTRHNLKNMNPKNSKKSPIHYNADANITCGFGDGDFSRLGVAYLTHTTGANERRDGRMNERHSHVDFLNLIVDMSSPPSQDTYLFPTWTYQHY